MTQVRVAVVIPCHNDGGFLDEALRSVAAQEPCELVVVDDGSTDPETLDVLRRAREAGVHVIAQANGGLSAARMAGVAATWARYVHPLDADDRLAPGALTLLADALDADSRAAATWGDLMTFGALETFFPKGRGLDSWRITFLNEITGTAMLRRDALLAVGGWDMGSGYEDWDLWMKLAERGYRGVHVPEVTLHYRQHATPRMYEQSVRRRHDELVAGLRGRHLELFAARRANRRRSPSPWTVKALFTAINAIPGLSALRRQQLCVLARHYTQPELSADTYRGVGRRLLDHLRGTGR